MTIAKDLEWSAGWQKDDRFSKNATAKLIEQAMKKDRQMMDAFSEGNLVVNAGPHRKAGPGGGGDARLHITVRIRGEGGWHVILDDSGSKFIKTEKRSKSQI